MVETNGRVEWMVGMAQVNLPNQSKCDITLISFKSLSHVIPLSTFTEITLTEGVCQSRRFRKNIIAEIHFHLHTLAHFSLDDNENHIHSHVPTLLSNSILTHTLCDVNRNPASICERVSKSVACKRVGTHTITPREKSAPCT